MGRPEVRTFQVEYPAEDVWRGINTPLPEDLEFLTKTNTTMRYEGLDPDGLIQQGTGIHIGIDRNRLPDVVKKILGRNLNKLPGSVALQVVEYNPDDGYRRDVLAEGEHYRGSLSVAHRVDAEGDYSRLTVEADAELSLHGLGLAASAMIGGINIQARLANKLIGVTQQSLEHLLHRQQV